MIKRDNTGFTLAETVIALGVVGLLLGLIANFAIASLAQSTVEAERANLLSQSQLAMDKVIADIRLAAGADQNNRWPDANNAGGIYAWSSDASNLVLATAVVDSNNNVIFADPSKYISEKNNVIYFVSGGSLYQRILASTVANNAAKTSCPEAQASTSCPADKKLLDNITGFNVKYISGDDQEVIPTEARSIELTIKTQISKFNQNITSDYTTRAVFRND